MNRRRATALSGGVLGAVTIAVSCRDPTQLTIRITTAQPCDQLSPVQTFVGPDRNTLQQRFETRFVSATSDTCDRSNGLIGTLVITPGGSTGAVLVAAGVRAGDLPAPDGSTCNDPEIAKRCILARRAFSFIDHEPLFLPINLDPLCIGKPCDPATTCFKGACVDATVVCQGSECVLPDERDAGVGVGGANDAGSSDGAYDDAADLLDGSLFEDVDAGRTDGATTIADAMPDAKDGSTIVGPPCAFSSPAFFCNPGANGLVTSGSCDGANPLLTCCHCTCPPTQTQVACTTSSGTACSNLVPMCNP